MAINSISSVPQIYVFVHFEYSQDNAKNTVVK